MKHKYRQILACAFAIASITAASPSFAVVASETSNELTSLAGVTITEFTGYYRPGYTGAYQVVNNSGSAIRKFQVSTGSNNTGAYTSRDSWYGSYLSKDTWESYYSESYGAFESFFGSIDTGVFEFSQGESGSSIVDGEKTDKEFLFNAVAASEFIAFDGKGSIVARSLDTQTSQVPEPGSLALLGLGVAGLSIIRRRRKN